jgi:hypothetical protein
MIKNDQELEATRERIRYFQQQVEKLRQTETNPQNYRLSAGGYLAEIDRMNLEGRRRRTHRTTGCRLGAIWRKSIG